MFQRNHGHKDMFRPPFLCKPRECHDLKTKKFPLSYNKRLYFQNKLHHRFQYQAKKSVLRLYHSLNKVNRRYSMIRYTARFLFRKPKGTAVSLPYADRSTQYGSFRRQQGGSSPLCCTFYQRYACSIYRRLRQCFVRVQA